MAKSSALARTFYRDPKVLILDEPTSSIDVQRQKQKISETRIVTKKIESVILISSFFYSTASEQNYR